MFSYDQLLPEDERMENKKAVAAKKYVPKKVKQESPEKGNANQLII